MTVPDNLGGIITNPLTDLANQSWVLIENMLSWFLIHLADPQSRPVVIIVFTLVVRPSVPTFQHLTKQHNFQMKIVIATDRTVGLVERIIDDTYLVINIFNNFSYKLVCKPMCHNLMSCTMKTMMWTRLLTIFKSAWRAPTWTAEISAMFHTWPTTWDTSGENKQIH